MKEEAKNRRIQGNIIQHAKIMSDPNNEQW